jgi:hypothetical protein
VSVGAARQWGQWAAAAGAGRKKLRRTCPAPRGAASKRRNGKNNRVGPTCGSTSSSPIGITSQNSGSTYNFWANPVDFRLEAAAPLSPAGPPAGVAAVLDGIQRRRAGLAQG